MFTLRTTSYDIGRHRPMSLSRPSYDVVRSVNTALYYYKKAVLPQGNRAMPQVFFSVEVRQQHSLQV